MRLSLWIPLIIFIMLLALPALLSSIGVEFLIGNETYFVFLKNNFESIIAFVALFAAFGQAHFASIQNKQSVQPLLTDMIYRKDETGEVCLVIKNVGLGPAIYKSFELRYANKKYAGNELVPLCNAIMVTLKQRGISGNFTHNIGCYYPDKALGAGQEAPFFLFAIPQEQHALTNALLDELNKLHIVIGYRSILGVYDTYNSEVNPIISEINTTTPRLTPSKT